MSTHTHTQRCTVSWMQIIWDKGQTRSACRDTRRLQNTTWLPKAPEAHVNSSLRPTSGLCILTKHLAMSAPVHHSRDPPTLNPHPTCLCVFLCMLDCVRVQWKLCMGISWIMMVHVWVPRMHIHLDLITGGLKLTSTGQSGTDLGVDNKYVPVCAHKCQRS